MQTIDFKPQAAITLSNHGGIEIMIDRRGDGLYYRFNYGQPNLEDERIFETEIQFDQEGEAYFQHLTTDERQVYYLNEAMRIN